MTTAKQNRSEMVVGMAQDEYRACTGRPYVTSHLLQIYMSGGIASYLHAIEHPPKQTEAKRIGSVFHIAMEGEFRLNEEFVSGGPVNPATGKTYGADSVKFSDWARTQSRKAIRPEELQLAVSMADAVKKLQPTQKILSRGHHEVCIRGEILGMPCQMLADYIATDGANRVNAIVDWKTCVNLGSFSGDALAYGYDIQMGFYRMLAREVSRRVPNCYIVAVEKAPQDASQDGIRSRAYRVKNDALHSAESKIVRFMSYLKKDLRKL